MDFGTLTGFQKIAILSGIMLLIFVTFYFALWRPGLSELKKYQVDLNKKATELTQLERDAKDWPDTITREMITRYENKLELLWDLIPTEEGLSLLLDEVQKHAIISGLEIISLKRENGAKKKAAPELPDESNKGNYEKASYAIEIRGGYFGLLKFIKSLEESDRLITINGIESQSNSDENPLQWGHIIETKVGFNIYYSKAGVEKA